MSKKDNQAFVVTVLFIVFALLTVILGGKAFHNKIVAYKNSKTRSTNVVDINWNELFPYDTPVEEFKVNKPSLQEDESLLKKIGNILLKFGTIGNRWAQSFYGYDDVSKIGYVIYSRLTDSSIGKTYIKLPNDYWITASSEITDNKAKEVMLSYATLNQYLKNNGSEFLYFLVLLGKVWDER